MGCNCKKGAKTPEDWLELAAIWEKRGHPDRAERLRKIAETQLIRDQKEIK